LGETRVGNLIFFAEKYTVGTVGTVAASTNRFVEAAGTVAAPTNRFFRGGTNRFVGTSDNTSRHYK